MNGGPWGPRERARLLAALRRAPPARAADDRILASSLRKAAEAGHTALSTAWALVDELPPHAALKEPTLAARLLLALADAPAAPRATQRVAAFEGAGAPAPSLNPPGFAMPSGGPYSRAIRACVTAPAQRRAVGLQSIVTQVTSRLLN